MAIPEHNNADSQSLAKRLLSGVVQDLGAGRKRQAARHFLAGVGHETMPPELGKLSWVRQVIGEDAARALVAALSDAPCFGCKLGYESCQNCGGSGLVADALVCRACVGFGQSRCDFCTGSGLATYNALPADFRVEVMARRVARAIRLTDRLAADGPGAGDAAAAIDREVALIMRFNKLLGVLENAVVAARTLIRTGQEDRARLEPLVKRIARSAASIEEQMRAALQRLAGAYRSAEPDEASDVAQANRQARAAFYEDLLDSPFFEGTGLEHFFLHPHEKGVTARVQEQAAQAAEEAEATDPEAADEPPGSASDDR
jgi:hypothetical protein